MRRAKLRVLWDATVCLANRIAPESPIRNPYVAQETLSAEAGYHAMKAAIKPPGGSEQVNG